MLHDLQRDFRATVLGSDDDALGTQVAAPRGVRSARIEIYRNNVQASLTEVLSAAFPVVERIVGSEFFVHLAQTFITAEPPRAPQLSAYGGTFPAFIIAASREHNLPYLRDVARLEWARNESYFAADAPGLNPEDLTGRGAQIGEARLRLHPAVRLIRSAFPIVAIWESNQPEHIDVPQIDMTIGENALVSRPGAQVMIRRITDGDAAMLDTLTNGATFGIAAEAALTREPGFDLQNALELNLRFGTFAGA